MAITPLPSVPLRSDAPATFVTKADAFLGALNLFATEVDAVGVALTLGATNATSTTSLLIGLGSKSLTVQTGKSYVVGMTVKIASTAVGSTWMLGDITSYTTGTGALVVTVTSISGSGTLAAWTISQSAPGGAHVGANADITSLSGLTTPLSVLQGGTGVATSTGTGASVRGTSPTISSPTISAAVMSSMASSVLTSGTAVASTSGASIDFTGIPSWAKRITVMFNGVSISGTSQFLIQLGAGTVTTSGYSSYSSRIATAAAASSASTAGFYFSNNAAAELHSGNFVITNISGNTWDAFGGFASGIYNLVTGGNIALGGTLDRVRITTVNGTDTFDTGSINLMYE